MTANPVAALKRLCSNVQVKSLRTLSAAVVLSVFIGAPALSLEDPEHLVPIHRDQMCVTKGEIEQKSGAEMEVTVPEMRAVVDYPTRAEAETRFTYLGYTKKDKPLGSGEIRRQFGLKLRAANGCNLVYAMWRIEPRQELVISEKLNPGQTTSAECGTHGYRNMKPTRSLTPPRLKEGEPHNMWARIEGSTMKVFIDGKLRWEGILDKEALALEGPSGVRTDNGRFTFDFWSSAPVHGEKTACHASEGDE